MGLKRKKKVSPRDDEKSIRRVSPIGLSLDAHLLAENSVLDSTQSLSDFNDSTMENNATSNANYSTSVSVPSSPPCVPSNPPLYQVTRLV